MPDHVRYKVSHAAVQASSSKERRVPPRYSAHAGAGSMSDAGGWRAALFGVIESPHGLRSILLLVPSFIGLTGIVALRMRSRQRESQGLPT